MDSLPKSPEDSMRRLVLCSFILSLAMAPLTQVGLADALETTLSEGDLVPDFEGRDAGGMIWRSEEHVGAKFIVVYFYPADLTAGCTRQACGFRDHMKELKEAGVEVVGVSGDSAANHQLFAKVNSLNFSLLSDEEGKISRAFGVPVREGDTITRMVDGVETTLVRGVTASRWTFLIDAEGRIVHKNTAVDAELDSKNILETVRHLTARAE
jgi:peroxiredoxin Q/BCP